MPEYHNNDENHQTDDEIQRQIEPLPPIRVDAETQKQFESWGVPSEFVTELAEICSLFRYDLCPEKAAQLAQHESYRWQDLSGRKFVTLPRFYDFNARGLGECTDIAVQLNHFLQFSGLRDHQLGGYIHRLNQYLEKSGKPRLLLYVDRGRSRTHFNAGQRHFWLGLRPENADESATITIDASMQEISLQKNNQYHSENEYGEIQAFEEYVLAREVELTRYTETPESLPDYDISQDLPVLGRSFDGKFIYYLGFFKVDGSDEIRPYVCITMEDANDGSLYVIIRNDGQYELSDNNEELTEEHAQEIIKVLENARKIKFVTDNDAAIAAHTHQFTIDYTRI